MTAARTVRLVAAAVIAAVGDLVELVGTYADCSPAPSRVGAPAIVARDRHGVDVVAHGSLVLMGIVRGLRFDVTARAGRLDELVVVPHGHEVDWAAGDGDGRVVVSRSTLPRRLDVVDARGVVVERWCHPADDGFADQTPRWIADVDGDGARDLVVGWSGFELLSPDRSRRTGCGVGIVSSRTGACVVDIAGRGAFGDAVGVAPGPHAEGSLLVLGGEPAGVVRPHFVTLWRIDPTSGEIVAAIEVDALGTWDASDVVGVGDATGDDVGDVAVGAPSRGDGRGLVLLIDGRDGSLLAGRHGEASPAGLGHALRAIGDIDGDGVLDLCATAPGVGRDAKPPGEVLLLSGRDLSVLEHLRAPAPRDDDGLGASLDVLVEPDRATLAVGASGMPSAIHVYDVDRR